MALVNCPNCQMQISEYVRKCPYCGRTVVQSPNNTTAQTKVSSPQVNSYQVLSSFYLKAAGVTHDGRQEVIKGLKTGEEVILQPDPTNPYDNHAVKILTTEGKSLGFIPKEHNSTIFSDLINRKYVYHVTVAAVTGGGSYVYGLNLKIEKCKNGDYKEEYGPPDYDDGSSADIWDYDEDGVPYEDYL